MRAWIAAVAALTLGITTPAWSGGSASPKPPTPPAVTLDSLPDSAKVETRMPDGKLHPVTTHLLTDRDVAIPGETFRLGLYLVQQKEWHTYWKSPGDIGLPTEITWSVPQGATTSVYEYPIPQRFEQSDIVSFGYDDQVLLFTEVTLPETLAPGTYTLGASAQWLVCKTSCIPGSAELELPLTVGSEPGGPNAYAPLFDHFAEQHPTPALEVEGFAVEAALSASAVRPNEPFKAAWLITPTSKTKLSEPPGKNGAWPVFTPIVGYDWMVNSLSTQSTDKGLLVVLEGETFEPDPLPKDAKIGGLFQVKVGDEVVATEILTALPWAAANSEVQPSTSPLWNLSSGAPPEDGAPPESGPGSEPSESASSTPDRGKYSLASGVYALVLALVGGLFLNAMPCVLPVLMLKLYGLVEQKGTSSAEQRLAGLAYTAGILVCFWLLAGAVSVAKLYLDMNVGWGFQFQYPGYVAALATVVFAFGLSLFGVFELPAVGVDAASSAGQREGPAGYFFTGMFATLVATPCTAPFMGPALGFAFGAPLPWLWVTFTALGLGLALPFLLIAFIPLLYRFLPSPGPWMESFKQFLGFTLMATTVWLLGILAEQIGLDRTVSFVGFLLFVALGCWVFGRWGGLGESTPRKGIALAGGTAIAFAGALYFVDLQFAEASDCDDGSLAETGSFAEEIPWQPFSEDRVAAAAGRIVFIDFTAEWCLTCKANERAILETSAVRQKMKELDVVPLKADWTRRDPVITEWLARYDRAGVPFYLVIPAGGGANIPLPEVITQSMVIDALEQAG